METKEGQGALLALSACQVTLIQGNLYAILKYFGDGLLWAPAVFTLNKIGSHWRMVGRNSRGSDLRFSGITLYIMNERTSGESRGIAFK